MAVIQAFGSIGFNFDVSDPLGVNAIDAEPVAASGEQLVLPTSDGGSLIISGSGFGNFDAEDLSTLLGTVTGVSRVDSGGQTVLSISNISESLGELVSVLDIPEFYGLSFLSLFSEGPDNYTGSDLAGDVIRGLNGNDFLAGLSGNDLIYGNRDDDQLFGGLDNDTIFGGQQNDFLAGEQGNDVLYGNFDSDVLLGGDGDDTIFAGQGDDNVNAEAGNDFLAGNRGNDTLAGGSGADEFRFNFALGQGANVISDFTAGEDRISVVNTAIGGVAAAFDAGANATLIRSDVAFDQGQFLRQPDGSVLFESAGTFQNTVVIVGGDFTGLIGDSILFT